MYVLYNSVSLLATLVYRNDSIMYTVTPMRTHHSQHCVPLRFADHIALLINQPLNTKLICIYNVSSLVIVYSFEKLCNTPHCTTTSLFAFVSFARHISSLS